MNWLHRLCLTFLRQTLKTSKKNSKRKPSNEPERLTCRLWEEGTPLRSLRYEAKQDHGNAHTIPAGSMLFGL